MFYRVLDSIASIITGSGLFVFVIKVVGGDIKLPFGMEIGLIPSALMGIVFAFYQAVRGWNLYEKTKADKREREQELRIKKYEADKIIGGHNFTRATVKSTKKQLEEINILREKYRKEEEEILKKYGL